jgi:ABC-type thiamine transport system substrate-binding protein
MLPVIPEIEIDPIFTEYGENAEHHVEPTTQEVIENYDLWYDAWREAFLG